MALAVPTIVASARASGNSLARTITPSAGGSLLVALAAWFTSSGSADPTFVGSVNGSYTKALNVGGDANSRLGIWYKENASASADTVTMNPPGATSDNDLTLIQITGAALASALDINTSATGPSGNPAVASGTLAQADEIIINGFSHTAGNTALAKDATYTTIDENESNSTGQTYHWQYKIVASTASDTADGTITGTPAWFSVIVSFKMAAAGAAFLAAEPVIRRHAATRASYY